MDSPDPLGPQAHPDAWDPYEKYGFRTERASGGTLYWAMPTAALRVGDFGRAIPTPDLS
ncbi:hypothetical protein [Streptomyces sp. NPDC048445]|uniref:hypothetical protein n=1 Tax=Streptomyces sp. NPDC048445 TaxID=3365553 RepID=UPI0037191864